MRTIWELILNISQASISGIIGVGAVLLFLLVIVGLGFYRAKELEEEHSAENNH